MTRSLYNQLVSTHDLTICACAILQLFLFVGRLLCGLLKGQGLKVKGVSISQYLACVMAATHSSQSLTSSVRSSSAFWLSWLNVMVK